MIVSKYFPRTKMDMKKIYLTITLDGHICFSKIKLPAGSFSIFDTFLVQSYKFPNPTINLESFPTKIASFVSKVIHLLALKNSCGQL